jgi:hypothetical protein
MARKGGVTVKRIYVTRAIAAATTVLGVTLAIAIVPMESAMSGALAWAQGLSATERLEYARPSQLAQLPTEYRRAIFGTLATAEERASFWRDVFASYQNTHVLTHDQLRVLNDAKALMVPSTFAGRSTPTRARAVVEAREAIGRALGPDAVRYLFRTAGPSTHSVSALPFLERMRYTWRTIRPAAYDAIVGRAIPPLYAWTCNCITDDDCHSYQGCCGTVACTPDTWWPKCGDNWNEDCTSLCAYCEEG